MKRLLAFFISLFIITGAFVFGPALPALAFGLNEEYTNLIRVPVPIAYMGVNAYTLTGGLYELSSQDRIALTIGISLFVIIIVMGVFLTLLHQKNTRLIEVQRHLHSAEELLEKENDLRRMLDSLPVSVLIADIETREPLYANQAYLAAGGFRSAEQLSRLDLSPLVDRVLGLGLDKPVSFTCGSFDQPDSEIRQRISAERFVYNNGKNCIVFIFEDITAQLKENEALARAAEKEKEANMLKSNFLANTSHEIRTPVNSIVGFSELALEESGLTPKVRDFLEKISLCSNMLMQIVNNILDISKIEAGKIDLENIPFDLDDVFQTCRAIIGDMAAAKSIELYCYAEPHVGAKLLGDPTKLRQVLLNLLSNSVKFTDSGIVKLMAAVEDETEDSVTIHFEVKDSGIGMSPEQIAGIFAPFAQADRATMRKYGGTGLGLPIAKSIVEAMGGEIAVASKPGLGSSFSFTLTMGKAELSSGESPAIPLDESERPVFHGEILLCEDNELSQMVIKSRLEKLGLQLTVAYNGQECLNIVSERMARGEKPFDLIFMDMNMPVMDGLEATDALCELGSSAPIVALTANVMPDDREIYSRHGIPDFLSKPFTTKDLLECLYRYFAPIRFEKTDVPERASEEDELRRKEHSPQFIKNNQSTFRDITAALRSGDVTLARRLAHTLKGAAGMLGEDALWEASRAVESMLADIIKNGDESRDTEAMDRLMAGLWRELEAALYRLAPEEQAHGGSNARLDKAGARELFERLEPLLKADRASCLDLIGELQEVPGTGRLISQIEDFEFETALETLYGLRKSLEV